MSLPGRLKHLNVGCGKIPQASTDEIEWVNLDKADVGADIVHDMKKGFPMFEDNTFDRAEAICCLGQIELNEDFLHVMNELHRVLKPGAYLYILLPHKDSDSNAYIDPFNQRRFNEATFAGFDEEHSQYINHNSYYGFHPWRVLTNNKANGFLRVLMQASK